MKTLIGLSDVLIIASLVMAIIPMLNPQITFRLKNRGYKKFVILLALIVFIVVLSAVIQEYSLFCRFLGLLEINCRWAIQKFTRDTPPVS